MSSIHTYASMPAVRRAITACSQAGLQVGSVKLHPCGAIELMRDAMVQNDAQNDFDRLDAEGLL